MITEINIQALKGVTGTYKAGKLNIVTGPNGCGKTAITDAIRLCLLGEHPELGKTASSLFQMASGPAMLVNLQFDDRPGFSRNWNIKGKTVKMTMEGDEIEVSSPPLNVREFLNANAKTRLSMVMDGGGQDVARVASERLAATGHAFTTFESMEAGAVNFEQMSTTAKAVAKRYSGMLDGMTVLDAQEPTIAAIDITAAQTEMKAAQSADEKARNEWQSCLSKSAAADDARERMPEDVKSLDPDVIMAAISDISEQLDQRRIDRDHEQARATLMATEELNLAVKQAKLQASPASDPAEIDRIQALADPSKSDVEQAAAEFASAEHDLMTIESDLRSLEKSMEKAESDRAGFDSLACCPTCKAAAKGWKAEVLKALDGKVAEIQNKIVVSRADRTKHKALFDVTSNSNNALSDARIQRQRLPQLEQGLLAAIQLQDVERRIREARDMRETLWESRRLNETKINELVASLKDFEDAKRKVAAANELQGIINNDPGEEALGEFSSNRDAARHRLEAATDAFQEAHEQALQRAKSDEREETIRKAREEMDTASEAAKTLANTAKEIRKVMQEEMTNAFWWISRAAQSLEEIFPLAMLDGEIGRWHGPTFAPFDALSGTEQLLATIALQVGLQGGQGALVMVDELSRLTDENKRLLRNQLQWMVSINQINQVFVIDHDSKVWTDGHDWTVIKPTRTETATK